MRLTFRDMLGAVLAAAAVLVALDLANGWGWPLLGDYRAGIVALGVIGFAMCAAASDYSEVHGPDPTLIVSGMLGVAALALLIAGLIYGTATLLALLALDIVLLWFFSTLRHVYTRAARTPSQPAAA